MQWKKRHHRLALTVSMFLAGGTVFQFGNCANAIYSLPICGAILTFCTPTDQLNVLFPLLETPDFNADPTCTIPLGCGDDNGANFFDFPDGFSPPGGDTPDPPEDESDGLGGGGGGGGGI